MDELAESKDKLFEVSYFNFNFNNLYFLRY